MKKLALLLCAALVSLSLAACGAAEAPQENKMEGYLETLSYSYEAWMDTDEALYNEYAVTDMNEDGCPEIVLTRCLGSGYFSETFMWKVSEDGEALLDVADSTEYGIQSDLGSSNSFRCYTSDGINYIITEDWVGNGYAEKYCDRYAFSYDGDAISEYCLAGFSAVASYEGEYEGFVKTYYINGEEVDAEDYINSDSVYFADASAKRIMDVSWFQIQEPESVTQEEILNLLKESWGGFGFRMAEEDNLLPDPGKDFEDAVILDVDLDEGIPPIEALQDRWYLYSGETEGWEWIAEDENTESSVVFSDSAATFRFKNDAVDKVFESLPYEVLNQELYSSCGNDQWSVHFKDESGENEFFASVTQPGVLQMLWMQSEGLEEGEYPSVCAMVFYNGL